jgi:hypothetical protein
VLEHLGLTLAGPGRPAPDGTSLLALRVRGGRFPAGGDKE